MRRVPTGALLVAVLVVLAGCASAIGPVATETPGGETQGATVIDVVDGDTLEVRFPDGSTDRVRLLGVDTPEIHVENEPGEFEGVPDTEAGANCLRDAGHNASGFVLERTLDATVTLVFDPSTDRRGSYGRLLAYVRLDGRNLNRRLVERGHARVYDSTFSRSERFYDLEATAQAERRGLWRCRSPGGTATPSADGPLRLVSIQADAPGDDHENLNGESLVLENVANATIDLTGWMLADSGGHTYRFPDGFTLASGARVTVFTGDGADNATSLYWGADGAVWNNDGDTVVVRTGDDAVVLERTYG